MQNTWQKGACFSFQAHESHCDSEGTYMQNNMKVRGESVNRKKRLEMEQFSIITEMDWVIKKQN